jgi:DedD protein
VFVVQLAALSDIDKAEALRARVSTAGLPAYTDTVGSLTRVRAGPFSTRAAAVAAAVKLAEKILPGQVVAQ